MEHSWLPSVTLNYDNHVVYTLHLQVRYWFVEWGPTLSYRWTVRAKESLLL
ncbi:hypothetical protein DPMN_094374 [Dreissena polymorpha]|uniref:Uncharacterized protein n=1 Tax=Dreissena polymorpha TaxID=45954 RepID=A0A9D4L4N3_DREPO|nr:hypothetical protein DPMN_094374 [Dreissena polymorpha]